MNKKLLMIVLIIIASLALAVFSFDSRLKITRYEVESEGENGPFRIAFVTDLHSCSYGNEMEKLIEAVDAQNPDAVLLGGDIFDSRRMPDENAVIFLKAMGEKYPSYFVSGNHEVRHEKLDEYKEIVTSCGVTVLDGTHTKAAISAMSGTLDIYGFDDTTAYENFEKQRAHIEETAKNFHFESSFNVLLIHRPEYFEHYADLGFDLVLCGHAHGGQWRIPGVLKGLYAPGQGLFPKYTKGIYELGETKMIVSAGLAKESTPLPRIFNRPEIVIIDVI